MKTTTIAWILAVTVVFSFTGQSFGVRIKDIADIKNLGDKPMAGSITAAKFLEFFTAEHPHWAHIDIAGTAFKTNGIARNHSATAFGVMLFYKFVQNLS